jgi:hypothetical protein
MPQPHLFPEFVATPCLRRWQKLLCTARATESLIGDIARQNAPNPTSQFPEHISDWYLTHPFTVSLLSVWLAPRRTLNTKRNGDIDVKSGKV